MNEIILLVVVIVLLFGTQFLLRNVKSPLQQYIRITAAIVLLLLAWVFSNVDNNYGSRIIISIIAITSAIKEIIFLRKLQP